jgi:hypothetical protein
METQIIGWCCGIGPEYIRLLKEHLPTTVPSQKSLDNREKLINIEVV